LNIPTKEETMEITITRNKELKSKPADDSLGFGSLFTDYMFNMDYDLQKGWHNPRIEPYGSIIMDPATMFLHYGQGIFEGLKAYRTDSGQIQLFRPQENISRLNRSCRRLCIPEVDENFALVAMKQLIAMEKDWVPGASETSLYVRPTIIAMDPFLGVRASHTYRYFIILSPVGAYYPEGFNPIKILVTSDYVRAVRGGIGEAKTPGNYAASLLAGEKAHEAGYTQVLWLDGVEQKYLEEVGSMNIFFVIDGEIITPALNGSILPGVTRNSVIELAKKWGDKITERKISIDELMEAHDAGSLQEVFGSGTAAVISPVGEIKYDDKIITIAGNEVGPFANKYYKAITDLQYGQTEDAMGWIEPVVCCFFFKTGAILPVTTVTIPQPGNQLTNRHRDKKMDDTNTGGYISDFLAKMEDAGLPPLVAEWFGHYYDKVLSGDTGLVYDHDISPVKPSEIGDSEQLDAYADTGRKAFRKSVRIVLNGGLGTSMGLTGPKS
jgi:branched-chain amino acid aminotransferase